MKEKFFVLKSSLLILSILSCSFFFSCSPPSIPPEVIGTFTTGSFGYNCVTGSPLRLTHGNGQNNSTRVTAQATSIGAPQYDSGLVVYGLQDSRISLNPYTDGCAQMKFPGDGAYSVVVRFIEGNSNCQPAPGQCWRWYTIQSPFPSRFIPNCGNTPLYINQSDPTGFVGPCL